MSRDERDQDFFLPLVGLKRIREGRRGGRLPCSELVPPTGLFCDGDENEDDREDGREEVRDDG